MSLKCSDSNKLVKQLTLYLVHFPLYVNAVKAQRISIWLNEAKIHASQRTYVSNWNVLQCANCEKRLSVTEYLTAAVLNYVQKLTSQSSVVLDFRCLLYFLRQKNYVSCFDNINKTMIYMPKSAIQTQFFSPLVTTVTPRDELTSRYKPNRNPQRTNRQRWQKWVG